MAETYSKLLRTRGALQTLADWLSIDDDTLEELYNQGILQHGDMPDWDEEPDDAEDEEFWNEEEEGDE